MKTRWWIKTIFVVVVVVLWLPILIPPGMFIFVTSVEAYLEPMYQMKGKSVAELRDRFGPPITTDHIPDYEIWHYNLLPSFLDIDTISVYIQNGKVAYISDPID